MIRTLQQQNELLKIFEPTERGVLGLADGLFSWCGKDGIQLDWQGDSCSARNLGEATGEPVEVPLPKSAFRALLARIAALCNEHRPNSVSPYGGTGEFVVGTESPTQFQAAFINTRAEQKLVLKRVIRLSTPANLLDAN